MQKVIHDTEFINWLENRFSLPLPGKDAHMIMSPKIRPPGLETLTQPTYKESSVLILFYPENGEWHLPFILRNDIGGPHKAQISFPGGKKEMYDENVIATALREAQEEVGIIPDDVRILGQLTDLFVPPSNFMVHPVVGYIDYIPDFIPDPKEVQKVLTTPLKMFLNTNAVNEKVVMSFQGFPISAPYFDLHGHTLWGATAMMMSELIEIAKEYK
ncbi:MAG: CoA pyrophosphatase [Bacteroidota bacterium]